MGANLKMDEHSSLVEWSSNFNQDHVAQVQVLYYLYKFQILERKIRDPLIKKQQWIFYAMVYLKIHIMVTFIIYDGGQHVVASRLMVKSPVAVYLVIVVPI